MEIKVEKCGRCGRTGYIIPSNNPLINGGICLDCINETIDTSNIDHFAFLCRTLNYPLNSNLYTSCYKQSPKLLAKLYAEALASTGQLSYNDSTTDKWKEVQKEWEKVNTYSQLLNKIDMIKDSFIIRCQEKWGYEYTFEQYLKLESQFTSIIKSLNMTNPTQIDTVKKYCKMSVYLDDLISGGEVKAISDATTALTKLADLAQIQELSETAAEGTIKTVADLYKYMEDHGFEFKYYDNVDRDVVDITIKDIQSSIRTEINNAIGLDVTLEQVKNNYMRALEDRDVEEAIKEVSIDDLTDSINDALDSYSQEDYEEEERLANEDIIFED